MSFGWVKMGEKASRRKAAHVLRSAQYPVQLESDCLADDLLFQRDGAGAAGRALDAIAELANVNLELADRAAQGVAVHAQFAGSAALVTLVLLEHGHDEPFLEFTHSFGIENIASVHLQDKCFQLIFHAASLSLLWIFHCTATYFGEEAGEPVN